VGWIGVIAAAAVLLIVPWWIARPRPEHTANALPHPQDASTGERPGPALSASGDPATPASPNGQSSSTRTIAVQGSFLESFGGVPTGMARHAGTAALDVDQLEEHYRQVVAAMQRRDAMMERVVAAARARDRAQLIRLRDEGRKMAAGLTSQLSALQSQLKKARESRPQDPVVQWLTGALLMHVGGEPSQLLPYFRRAVAAGLDRPQLFSSLGRAQFESNQFADAYRSACRALDADDQNKSFWMTYSRVALGTERFEEVVARLDRAFPQQRPEWATTMRQRAVKLLDLWRVEENLRRAEAQTDNLPRVRMTIEHRRFARDQDGRVTSNIETLGTGEVEIELFEDQAPATVTNFIDLASKGFYDDTLFPVAESASYVRGGDPATRNDDPRDDGTGGPGYTIPDEFDKPAARATFRGSLSMVNTGPHTAGSQFFITLTPHEQFNGHFTVFGRVVDGQEVVDQITPGRTTKDIGHYGRIVPGDRLVRVEVIRKRPHAYQAIREAPR